MQDVGIVQEQVAGFAVIFPAADAVDAVTVVNQPDFRDVCVAVDGADFAGVVHFGVGQVDHSGLHRRLGQVWAGWNRMHMYHNRPLLILSQVL